MSTHQSYRGSHSKHVHKFACVGWWWWTPKLAPTPHLAVFTHANSLFQTTASGSHSFALDLCSSGQPTLFWRSRKHLVRSQQAAWCLRS